MAKIPALQRLLVEDFPDQAQWIQKLIGPLNDFMENDIYALSKKLTYSDNISAQIQYVQVQASTTFLCDTVAGSTTLTNLGSTVGFFANMPVQGMGIVSNTKIASFANKLSFVGNTTSGSNVINNIGSTATLIVGQPITGSGILPNSSIISIDTANSVQMNSSALATATNVPIYASATAVITNAATETNYGADLVAGGIYPVSFNCTLGSKPSFLWVAQAQENASTPQILANAVFCDWSYINGSIVINSITGLKGSLINGSPRTFNLTLLIVLT